jgi:hypothetical protein
VVNVIQLTNGVTFINENANGLQLDGLSIRSVTLGSVVEENALGWYTSRTVTGARIVCFASGTRIATPDGSRAVETLKPGDMVQTHDNGPQPLLWCAAQVSTGQGKAAPVTIQSGALGANRPNQTLRLSRQHRVLIRSALAVPLVGQKDVLVAAKDLIGIDGLIKLPAVIALAITICCLRSMRWFLPMVRRAKAFFPARWQLKPCLIKIADNCWLCYSATT